MSRPRASVSVAVLAWLRAFAPARLMIDGRERGRALLGAFLGMLFTAAASHWLAGWSGGGLWLLAPLGASTVLIFVMPASPLAQPWAVLGGNFLSAAIGLLCATAISSPVLAAPVAVAMAIAVMLALRCLHPPSGGMALLAVLAHGGPNEISLGVVLTGSLLLIVAGIAYNPLTGRRYPHPQQSPATPDNRARFHTEDLDVVLSRYNQVLDVSRDELAGLLDAAETQSYRRRLGELRCGDCMAPPAATAEFGTPLHEAWKRMHTLRTRALPVIDSTRRIVGIITRGDLLRAAGIQQQEGAAGRLRALLAPSGQSHGEKPEVVGQVMQARVRTLPQDASALELVAVFEETGYQYLPIVDADKRLAGMVSLPDLLRELSRRE